MRELNGNEVGQVSGGWSDDSGTLEFFVTFFLSLFESGPSAVDIAVTTPTASNGP